MQRRVAIHHVEELTGFQPSRGNGQPDPYVIQAFAAFLDRLDLAHDVAQDFRFGDSGQRHLDALLDRDRHRPRLDRGGVRANAIGYAEARSHFGCVEAKAGRHRGWPSNAASPRLRFSRPSFAPTAMMNSINTMSS